jgi:hypothetical protein
MEVSVAIGDGEAVHVGLDHFGVRSSEGDTAGL